MLAAEKFGTHEEIESDKIDKLRPFENCMPIEEMAARGPETLRYGPLKPTRLTNPRTDQQPHTVIQLQQDDQTDELWSMVGFQTRMRHKKQIRIIQSLPNLAQVEFVHLESVHHNSFIESPKLLDNTLQSRTSPGLFFTKQITKIKGYVESAATELLAGINAAHLVLGKPLIRMPTSTTINRLIKYVSDPAREFFQPMNISFGLITSYFENDEQDRKKINKNQQHLLTSKQALREYRTMAKTISV